MVTLFINEKEIEVEKDVNLITAIDKAGFSVPTLCYHKALSPYGACRLCVVEIHFPNGVQRVEASCSYPVQEGIKVYTETERIKKARKIIVELLYARCPDSDVLKKLAYEYGIEEPRVSKKNDDCIYCGLCVRMCAERMGRSAIGFVGRGPKKELKSPFGKHNPMCWTCGACNFICPVGKKVSVLTTPKERKPIPNTFNLGLDDRPSIYILYPQAVPNKACIDPTTCLHLNYEVCGICKEVCEAGAIDYEQKEETIELDVGAIVLTPGFQIFDPIVKEDLGYKKYPNVVTSLEFERILSASGPFSGEIKRPSDGKHPEKIAFIQCVGSREEERDYCSSVCCMYATKEAIIAREHAGENLQCDIYFMDVRAFSKGFEAYFESAKKQGINYIRCRVPLIKENSENHNPIVTYLDENDRKVSKEYDMVVLSVGLLPPKTAREIALKFGLKLNEFGFCETDLFEPISAGKEGIYVAGPFTEPKDIPETVMQASAAASKVMSLLSDVRGTLIKPKEYPPEKDVSGEEPRIGVFICHCGTNIAGVVNVPEVVEYAKTLPNVVWAENFLYTCSADACEKIKERIQEHNLNKVVVASCTPRTHEPLFRSVIREAGLNEYLFEMANIRDQCSWVHMHEPESATIKAKDLVRMAVAKAKLLEPLYPRKIEIKKSAMVIGGGFAGMTSALDLAEQGYKVYLVEREGELGGNMRKVRYLLNSDDVQGKMKEITQKVISHPNIEVMLNAQLKEVEGSIGNFKSKLSVNGNVKEIDHGVVIIATGAREYIPPTGLYLYGEDDRVITQNKLEEMIAEGRFNKEIGCVVMIQCVGSRDEERPYCSRICCIEAVKNAIKIKEISSDTEVYVLYRDMRTYGFNEAYYTRARRMGVKFIRYPEDKKPEVLKDGKVLKVRVFDEIINVKLEIPTDMLILSTGIVPYEDAKELAQLFKVPLTQEGFFLEAHMKLRPVDFATDGVFLCGLAHFPKTLGESIIQASAASSRAGVILAKDYLELEGNISTVIDENCDGCAYCVEPCPAQAITLIEYAFKGAVKKTVEVNESICKGCGVCMATCPKRGIMVKGFTLDQLSAMVEAALESPVGR